MCTLDVLADLFEVSRGCIGNAVRKIQPLLAQDGYTATPATKRFRTAPTSSPSSHPPTTRTHTRPPNDRVDSLRLHKIRNVQDRLPEKLRPTVTAKIRRAYHAESALAAEAELTTLAAEIDCTHPGAAASLREGMAETLTVLRLGVSPTLARTLRSTNAIESMIGICRDHATNVKRWRDGQMALRWCAAGMVEAGKQFRRVNGHLHLRSLRDTLEQVTQPVGTTRHDETVNVA